MACELFIPWNPHVDKSAIVRAIQVGKINATRNEFGDYEITPEALSKYRRRHLPRQRQVSEIIGEIIDRLAELEALMQTFRLLGRARGVERK
jgi:hypothetical protein